MSSRPPFGLFILDGLAHNPNPKGNAVFAAKKPALDRLFKECPYTELVTWGEAVGLPEGQMGNSEVGHFNIGAGRVVEQDLLRIARTIRAHTLKDLPAFRELIRGVKEKNSALHLLGLCSTGGVHSSMEHLIGILDEALAAGVPRIFIHAISDGRDRPQTASLEEVKRLDDYVNLQRSKYPKQELAIVDVTGRYYAMDRDKRWDRTSLAYELYTSPNGEHSPSILEAIKSRIALGETDEFYRPVHITVPPGYRSPEMQDGDSVLCFNFRPDRMVQICAALLGHDIPELKVSRRVKLASIVTLTEYEAEFHCPMLFPPVSITNHLGNVISNAGLKQFRMAETEKYPHVTYFFNGGVEDPLPEESRQMVQSPKDVPTYDFKPEMSAYPLTDAILEKLDAGETDIFIVNYANCDMVGHTGVLEAGVKAVETVDTCMGRILEKLAQLGGSAIVTADHGNADQMIDYETGKPHTFHTMHPVPCVIFGPLGKGKKLRQGGALCDIAPTMLELLELPQPAEMTGRSLVVK